VTIGHVVTNLVFALLGNIIGAAVFVAGGYWYLYLQGRPPQLAPTGAAGADTTSNGTVSSNGKVAAGRPGRVR
jgi:hypothetical protein